MARLFTGDYSTGDFSQWDRMANQGIPEGTGLNLAKDQPVTGNHSAQIVVDDADCGYAARFEVRNGDVAYFDPSSSERTEVFGRALTVAPTGSTRWYAMSVRFDSSFPLDHSEINTGIVTQFHDWPSALESPTVALGWLKNSFAPGFRNGYWYIRHTPREVFGPATAFNAVCEMPIDPGLWQDIKLQIKWEQDNTGFIRAWRNGERQTLLGGVTTYYGQTVAPSGPNPGQEVTGITVQQGYYRTEMAPTGIVYHKGFRIADEEMSL